MHFLVKMPFSFKYAQKKEFGKLIFRTLFVLAFIMYYFCAKSADRYSHQVPVLRCAP